MQESMLQCIKQQCSVIVIVQHAQDKNPIEKNAFRFIMLIEKFTKKTDETVQILVNNLNGLQANFNEEPPTMIERFGGLCVAIRALDRVQLPNLIGVLKSAIKIQYGLWITSNKYVVYIKRYQIGLVAFYFHE